ncbi:TonB-dependent receptor domain-containing protein [Zhouia sp. PK063]|uniref:TonB-dependent receptor domain-containing protein n=1 Tax=Zhouia sp. PK063 TaxID=3373602 RepID=UPI003794FC15
MNFKSITLLFITIIGFCLPTMAQEGKTITISGKIIDKDNNDPLSYATVALKSTSDPSKISGGITDDNGNFNIQVASGNYTVTFTYISYKKIVLSNQDLTSNKNYGTVKMVLDVSQLDEVEVTSEKTQVQVRLDKKVYNIGKDLTTQGATMSDALANVPSVTVDVDGTINLRGNENVKILIDGKPSAMAGFGDTNIFQQLPADAIERVEVITSPSARYDAEGSAGILNIILKKDKILGFNGSVSLSTGIPDNHKASVNLNWRTKKFNFFNTTGVYYRKSPGYSNYDNEYDNSEIDKILENRDYDRLNRGVNTNIGAEYFITNRSSITGSMFMRFGNDEDINTNNTFRYSGNDLNSSTIRKENETEKDRSYQTSLNYVNNFNDKGHKLTADFQYSYNNEDKPTSIMEHYVEPTTNPIANEDIFENEESKDFLIQSDYVLPMGDAQFEAGYRGTFKQNINDYKLDTLNTNTNQFETNKDLTNKFTYKENINAFYTQYGNKFGDFSFLLGLRFEQTNISGKVTSDYRSEEELENILGNGISTNFDKNYFKVFPTVNFIYELSENQNISLGYNRRINRPRNWFINPFPSRTSRTNINQGNPDLDPAYSDAFDLGYLRQWDKLTLTGSIYYQHETDSFERVQQTTGEFTSDSIPIIRTLPVNLATTKRYGAEVGAIYNPAKWLRLNSSFNFFKSTSEGFFNDVDYGSENNSWFTRFSSKISLPAKIDWQTNAFYRGPRQNSQTKTDGMFSLDLAFSKNIMKDNGTITFNVSDLLNSRKMNSYTESEDFSSQSEFMWRKRQLTLSFIYRFNQPANKRNKNNNHQNDDFGGDDSGFEG